MASPPLQVIAQLCQRRIATSHMLSLCSLHDCTELFETTSMYVEALIRFCGNPVISIPSSVETSPIGSRTTGGLCNSKCRTIEPDDCPPSPSSKISAQKPDSQKNSTGFGSSCCHDLSSTCDLSKLPEFAPNCQSATSVRDDHLLKNVNCFLTHQLKYQESQLNSKAQTNPCRQSPRHR